MTVHEDAAETAVVPFEVPPPPLWRTFEDFLDGVPMRDIRYWCGRKAVRANRDRLMSGRPKERITTDDVVSVLTDARGRSSHCGSLAVAGAPMHQETRKPLAWAHIGRRIGSLDHFVARIDGGPNTIDNLRWSCHWCNTWPSERIPGAKDHGAIQPDGA
ncbi:HNH endonuclease [Streptomyces sp. NBC_01384]|uniref:HNH endonuclease n=1 Tax=Streptomyces sp. NBC_01384 TaxID=2903847 RepID=UPI00324432E3